ncbi:MAG: SAM-dependent methyltransferase [Acidimicrobiia bacterium]|nr:SAM-dependent methyltransferase [Acidimicrobiia bacterium]
MWAPLPLLFAASGAAALICETVWLQALELVIGSSAVSIGVLLATFMGGMCLGSLALPRVVSPRRHPLLVLGLVETAIGGLALAVQALLPAISGIYGQFGGAGIPGLALRGAIAGLLLLPPTMAMGASIPAIARWTGESPLGITRLGWIYAANVGGAVAGALLAGFYLLRVFDMHTAITVAVALNFSAAAMAFLLAFRWRFAWNPPVEPPPAVSTVSSRPTSAVAIPRTLSPVLLAVLVSGFSALAAEAVWTRLLGMLLGPTVYAFAIMLAVFLAGLAGGAAGAAALARRWQPRAALGWCQLLVPLGIGWTAHVTSAWLPYWDVPPQAGENLSTRFAFDALRTTVAVLPATLLWGASLPLALAAAAGTGSRDPGRTAAAVYASNALGAVFGALAGAIVLLPWLGTQGAGRLITLLSILAGLIVLVPERRRAAQLGGIRLPLLAGVTAAMLAIVLSLPPVPGLLVAYGQQASAYAGYEDELIFVGEGMTASVAVSRLQDGTLLYHNAGKVQASSQAFDMRLQRMLGHLTTLVPAHPRSVLVVGCGAGATAGAVSIDPRVERVTVVEIEPLVPPTAAEYFSSINHDVLRSPKTRVVIDDARHFLLTTTETYDAITADPLDPWVKGSAALYTREFFETVRSRLNPGGVMTLFVQLYLTTPDAVKSELATFFSVFPDGVVWANTAAGRGYDLVLLGHKGPAAIDLGHIRSRLERPEYADVVLSLAEVDIGTVLDLAVTYAGRAVDLGEWLRDATINTDANLRLQYLAGVGSATYEADSIFADLERHRRFPPGLFVGADDLVNLLRLTMRPPLPPVDP